MHAILKCLGCADDSNDNNNKGKNKGKGGGAGGVSGGGFSEIEDKGKPQENPDNKSGLNVRQVFSLKQSWKGVMRDDVGFGVEMFISHIGPDKEKWLIPAAGEPPVLECRIQEEQPAAEPEEEEEEEGAGGACAGYTAAGISYKQGFSLRQSWKGIKRKMEDTGVEMFVRLFRSNSQLQSMFKNFKDIKSDTELRSNEALENHATLVMTTLDDAITHIDNYEYVKDLLYRTSATHTKFAGFHPEYFMHVKEPFLEAVRVTLGDRYTDNMQTIYTIAITYILQTLKDGMEEAMK